MEKSVKEKSLNKSVSACALENPLYDLECCIALLNVVTASLDHETDAGYIQLCKSLDALTAGFVNAFQSFSDLIYVNDPKEAGRA